MTAPIRDMAGLVEAARLAKIERKISDQTLEAIAGLANGSVSKYLGPVPSKNLGPLSTFLVLGALGKALVLVDDAEQIERVKGRWQKRSERGAAKVQLRKMAPNPDGASIETNLRKLAVLLAQMTKEERILAGASKGGKRRAKVLGKRARQRIAAHAARKRWAKAHAG